MSQEAIELGGISVSDMMDRADEARFSINDLTGDE